MTLKLILVAGRRPVEVALSEYPVPRALNERSENAATPLMLTMGVVPDSVPDPGLVPMARAIGADEVVTTMPAASSTLTTTEGTTDSPSAVLEGCVVNTNFVATFDMSKLAFVALVKPELDAVSETPEAKALPEHPEKVTTPFVGIAVVPEVQLSISPPLIDSVIGDA